jgi:hypothetical protein
VYTLVPPSHRGAPIFYTTKTSAFAAGIANGEREHNFGLVGRQGLPSHEDVLAFRRLVSAHRLFFLGDLDPPDLLIFAWLRARLRPKRIRFLGICDRYLDQRKVVLPETFVIRCSPSERRSTKVLKSVFPDMEQFIGKRCDDLPSSGRKIELEAVVSAMAGAGSIVPPGL